MHVAVNGIAIVADLTLHWLPKPADFKGSLAEIAGCTTSDPARAAQLLRRLASQQVDYFGTLQLDRRLTEIQGASGSWPEVRVALLGTCSVDHLRAPIRIGGARQQILITTYAADFGQHRQELMLAASGLHAFKPDVVLLCLQLADVLEPLPLSASLADVDAAIVEAVEDMVGLWRLATANLGATVIQHTFLPTAHPLFGNFDTRVPASPRALATRLNIAVAEAADREGVLLLDLAGWAQTHGMERWFDRTRWFHAKQLVAPTAAVFYGDLVGRMVAAVRGASAKCLVLDLDNTLWGGVIGDDGLSGIVLGQGSAAGEAFVAFQHYVRQLAERGVILAVCSKNDPAVAEEAFTHADMVLRREDIAVFVANWEDKPANLRRIAQALNIGIDSLVFFDDNPAEREIVRQTLPDVRVLEVPADCTEYVNCLAESGFFEAVGFTQEDQTRGKQYAANAERQKAAGTDLPAFLRSLDMRLLVAEFDARDMARIVQLTGKTNQFNLTTRRHNTSAMEAFASDPACIALSFRLLDRFGDNGLICVAVAVPEDRQALRVDTLLMSCRVLGRQVEEEVLHQIVLAARERGACRLIGEYRPTPRNGMVRDLYRRLGFNFIGEAADGCVTWSLDLADYLPPDTAITIVTKQSQPVGE